MTDAERAGLCYPGCWDLPGNDERMQRLRDFAAAALQVELEGQSDD